jgi:hypothetical protein
MEKGGRNISIVVTEMNASLFHRAQANRYLKPKEARSYQLFIWLIWQEAKMWVKLVPHRFKEAAGINKFLSVLAISALIDKFIGKKNIIVPYPLLISIF